MKIQRFEVSQTPHLAITCLGDLDISGGREGEVAVKAYGSEQSLSVEREGERLTIEASARCKIGCPQGTSVTVRSTHGSLRIRRLDGPIAVEEVHGDTTLKDIGPATITAVNGDVRARGVRGELRFDRVAGDLMARGVEGILSSQSVGGDLNVSYLEGGLDVNAGGDGSLTTDFTAGCDYRVTVGGDVRIKFPTNASANVQVSAGDDIHHKVEWAEIQTGNRTLNGRVGEGEANVEISAGGSVSLRSRSDAGAFVFSFIMDDEMDIELESMAEEIERNVAAHMANLEAQLSRIDHEAIRRKAERAADKVRRKAEQAAERARLRAERAQRRWERMGAPRPSRPPSPPPAEPISEKERLMVLQMVQEGKISAKEAAKLLEAMEG